MSDALMSNRWAWVFPGQGSQYVGMGKHLYENSPAARQLFDLADETLGFKLSELCFNGPEADLNLTHNAQPALLVTSIATLAALREREQLPEGAAEPAYVAGHSLGEFTALVAGGSLAFTDGVRLVRERGRLCQQAGDASGEPGVMIAVLGLTREPLEQISASCDVDIANFNTPTQTVLSGLKSKIEQASDAAKAAGARRVVPLTVSAAFHSRLMRGMADELAQFMTGIPTQDVKVPLIANVTASEMTKASDIHRELVKLNYSPVQWVNSLEYMSAQGINDFIEVGPGKVLTGLIKATLADARCVGAEQLLA